MESQVTASALLRDDLALSQVRPYPVPRKGDTVARRVKLEAMLEVDDSVAK